MTNIFPTELKIVMIGTGYVGLVSGTCFAELGFPVVCLDKDKNKIKQLKEAIIPIYEPGLEHLVKKNMEKNRLVFDVDSKAVVSSDVIFIAVGTPTRSDDDDSADLSYIEAAVLELAPLLTTYKTIVIKSTVPVGTCRQLAKIIRRKNPNAQFHVVSNPEFLREGSAVSDFMKPDRVIVGLENECSKVVMDALYQPLMEQGVPVVYTNLETSEMIKYTANCFLATKIAFINEMAILCEEVNADIEKVVEGIGLDKRIGHGYLQVGPGFGGSCFPKDTKALAHFARKQECPLNLVETVISSNERHKQKMLKKIVNACSGSVQGKTIALLGVAFKANTDDIRDSAAVMIIQGLLDQGARIRSYDPIASNKAKFTLKNVKDIDWFEDAYEAIKKSDVAVIATEWDEFRTLDFDRVKECLNQSSLGKPMLIDLRNLFVPSFVAKQGIHYISLGRQTED